MKRRPAAKLVLLALADKAHDDGRNAWPSIATIGGESELGEHTVRKCLEALKHADIIQEQAPPRYRRGEGRRARAWMLNLERLATLAPPHTGDLENPTARTSADLDDTDGAQRLEESATPHNATAAPHFSNLTPHCRNSTPRTSADDPVLEPVLNSPLNEKPVAAKSAAPAPTPQKPKGDEKRKDAETEEPTATTKLGRSTNPVHAELLDAARATVSTTWPLNSQQQLLDQIKSRCPGKYIESDALEALRRAVAERHARRVHQVYGAVNDARCETIALV